MGRPGHVHVFAARGSGTAQLEMGRCIGGAPRAPVPSGAAAASLRALRLTPQVAQGLAQMGYRSDSASDRLIGPYGPVSVARAAYLLAPVDASRTVISAVSWGYIQSTGYRLDEATCRLTHPEHGPLLGVGYEQLEDYVRRYNEHTAMETLHAGLRGLPQGAAVPPALIAQLRSMESAQVRLPETLRRRLFVTGRPPTVASLSASVTSAYLASTRYFDGQRDSSSFVMASRALNERGAIPERTRVPVSSSERRLGDLLSRELQSVFATTPAGRELMAHFRGRDGVVRLPPLLVLKMTQRADDPNAPGAAYYDDSRQIIYNHWELARELLNLVPPAERAQRAREFTDANAVRRYLEANPRTRRRLVETIDHLVLHEFVHYRQGDVARVMTETRRGNVPGPSLSVEHEAHRQECRYFLERVAANPSLLAAGYGGNRQEYCPFILRDPARLDNYVTDLYMRTFSGSLRLSDLSRMQDTRRSAALAMIMSGRSTWTERFNQGLRIIGLGRGDDAIAAERRRVTTVNAAYARALTPLRAQVATVPQTLARAGQPVAALRFLQSIEWAAPADVQRDVLIAAATVLAARDRRTTRDERLSAIGLVIQRSNALNIPLDQRPLARAYIADAENLLAELRALAPTLRGAQAQQAQALIATWQTGLNAWRRNLRDAEAAARRPR